MNTSDFERLVNATLAYQSKEQNSTCSMEKLAYALYALDRRYDLFEKDAAIGDGIKRFGEYMLSTAKKLTPVYRAESRVATIKARPSGAEIFQHKPLRRARVKKMTVAERKAAAADPDSLFHNEDVLETAYALQSLHKQCTAKGLKFNLGDLANDAAVVGLDDVGKRLYKSYQAVLYDLGAAVGAVRGSRTYSADPLIKTVIDGMQGAGSRPISSINKTKSLWDAFVKTKHGDEEAVYRVLFKNNAKLNSVNRKLLQMERDPRFQNILSMSGSLDAVRSAIHTGTSSTSGADDFLSRYRDLMNRRSDLLTERSTLEELVSQGDAVFGNSDYFAGLGGKGIPRKNPHISSFYSLEPNVVSMEQLHTSGMLPSTSSPSGFLTRTLDWLNPTNAVRTTAENVLRGTGEGLLGCGLSLSWLYPESKKEEAPPAPKQKPASKGTTTPASSPTPTSGATSNSNAQPVANTEVANEEEQVATTLDTTPKFAIPDYIRKTPEERLLSCPSVSAAALALGSGVMAYQRHKQRKKKNT